MNGKLGGIVHALDLRLSVDGTTTYMPDENIKAGNERIPGPGVWVHKLQVDTLRAAGYPITQARTVRMKLARNIFAALLVTVAAAACDSNPIQPSSPNYNSSPTIGSGIGTG